VTFLYKESGYLAANFSGDASNGVHGSSRVFWPTTPTALRRAGQRTNQHFTTY